MSKKSINISVTGGSAKIGNISQGSKNVMEATISSELSSTEMFSEDGYVRFDVFISYSHKDESVARKISAILKESNIRTFLASDEVVAGQKFSEKIQIALKNAGELWVIMSNNSLNSEWVVTEWGTAWAMGKHIVPILYDCEVADLPEGLSAHQSIRVDEVKNAIPSLKTRAEGYRKSKL